MGLGLAIDAPLVACLRPASLRMLTMSVAAEVVDLLHGSSAQARQRPTFSADEGEHDLAAVLERGQERCESEMVTDPQLVGPGLRQADVDELAVRAVGVDGE